ncbi:thioredoxin-like protein [Hyaloscypha bicolor E]|uniref:Thioredoxin-like protein n=1 Tax=Hyaloscypha bicolor E TaxID=1095630 RepID=A0A2J6TJV8_9HELO|nr:thioredoxin-like protein [Hyaloscypha bicolor E]PMD63303.1 thioredoxin-like protein [Hyaloscypha bicolor E]
MRKNLIFVLPGIVAIQLPADITPVCTTELGAFAKLKDEFEKRGVKMIDAQDLENIDQKGIAFTIRSVFIIDPAKKIRLTMMYPANCGRNTLDVLRVIDSLQTADKRGVTTPINWQVGDDVIVPPTVSTEDTKKRLGEVRKVTSYLRYTKI